MAKSLLDRVHIPWRWEKGQWFSELGPFSFRIESFNSADFAAYITVHGLEDDTDSKAQEICLDAVLIALGEFAEGRERQRRSAQDHPGDGG
jgi:hypothetical protein